MIRGGPAPILRKINQESLLGVTSVDTRSYARCSIMHRYRPIYNGLATQSHDDTGPISTCG